MTVWDPEPAPSQNCKNCGMHGNHHIYNGHWWDCPATPATATWMAPQPAIQQRQKRRGAPVQERACKKCGNKSLRAVTLPDTQTQVAMCRLCGKEEEL